MKISVSNLNFLATETHRLCELPNEVGLELFVEFGDDCFWNAWFKRFMKDRKGGITIHAPFQNLDLSDASPAFFQAAYHRTFRLARDWHAEYVVIHPNAPYTRSDGQRAASKEMSLHHIQALILMSEDYGVPLAVENMGYANPNELLFSQEEYLSIFDRFPQIYGLIDTGKLLLAGWDLSAVLCALQSRIIAYHLHDNNGLEDQHLNIGAGVFPWGSFWESYRRYTPDARIVLEYMGIEIEQVTEDIRFVQNQLM